jgi:hypothetical protein
MIATQNSKNAIQYMVNKGCQLAEDVLLEILKKSNVGNDCRKKQIIELAERALND